MMRAKMQVTKVTKPCEGVERLEMMPVCGKEPFALNGESEDNTFARWTPSGSLSLDITNTNLHEKFNPGDKYYLVFTKAEE